MRPSSSLGLQSRSTAPTGVMACAANYMPNRPTSIHTSKPSRGALLPYRTSTATNASGLGAASSRLPGAGFSTRGSRAAQRRKTAVPVAQRSEPAVELGNTDPRLDLAQEREELKRLLDLDVPLPDTLAKASTTSHSSTSTASTVCVSSPVSSHATTSTSTSTSTAPEAATTSTAANSVAPPHTDLYSTPPNAGEQFGDPTMLAWGALLILAFSYADWACNCFALPSMLPDISQDLHLDDVQGALLTTGYTYFFAFCMIPLGMIADKVSRPKLLAVGISAWSLITGLTAGVRNFPEMMGLRLGFAAAQSIQNPVALALVPEIFPKNKSASLAVYNSSLYFGRALSFSAALQADKLGKEAMDMGASGSAWRDVLWSVALPGFLIAGALWAFIPEPKDSKQAKPAATTESSPAPTPAATAIASAGLAVAEGPSAAAGLASTAAKPEFNIASLLKSPTFMLTTLGASCTDIGYYSLGAFQATFYERVYHLEPSMYAPTLQWVLPLGGIVGGIGGGYLADKLSASGKRAITTAGSTALAVPFMVTMLLADSPTHSFIGLFCALSLAESWRAPAANMARSAAPPENGSSAMSMYLCIRNLVGGAGPVAVALLAQHLGGDLQDAMLLIPCAYLSAATLFGLAELQFNKERKMEQQAEAEAEALLSASVPSS